MGREGARERTQLSPQAEAETSGLCADEVAAEKERAEKLKTLIAKIEEQLKSM